MGGIFLNRGRLLLIMLFIPCGIIFGFIDKILLAIGEQQEVADKTWLYVLIVLPGQIFFSLTEIKSKYLSGIG